ncbi:hypothetical protein Ndes2526B_g04216 [Nannochloris sp. 'desiccata']|nr:hypothetical protein KSW81_001013 [Chlorella desiccata (nom. nud.)]KAH7620297.1 hypothetical protein NADE_002924 [Chlorella desiccata (nom. nud.)]
MAPTQTEEKRQEPDYKFIPPVYRTPLSKRRLGKHYTKTLASLPFPVEAKIVATQWGKAHILVAGPPDAIPLFLWQATAAPGPFMLSLFSSFVPNYRVYVADVPCQAGSRSEQARFDPDKNELGQWSAQVITGCLGDPEPANNPNTVKFGTAETIKFSKPILHAGISFGGGVIVDLARVKPSLISAAALIVPSSLHPDCTTYGYFFEVTRKVFLPMMAYRWLPCKITKNRVFSSMFDEPDLSHPAMKQQDLAFKNILWFPRPAKHVESKKEFENYTAPTLLITAEQDVFGGGEATASRAREVFENCDELVVEELKETKHVPSAAKMINIMSIVEKFFAERGFSGEK